MPGMSKIYRRHVPTCSHRHKGRSYMNCRCPLWAEITDEGNRQRQSLKTRNLQRALKKLAELETRGPAPVKELKLVSEAVADFLANKKPELEPVTYQKYVQRLGLLQEHCD